MNKDRGSLNLVMVRLTARNPKILRNAVAEPGGPAQLAMVHR
jgi:hypothetical protein